jgi:hypothetical protein
MFNIKRKMTEQATIYRNPEGPNINGFGTCRLCGGEGINEWQWAGGILLGAIAARIFRNREHETRTMRRTRFIGTRWDELGMGLEFHHPQTLWCKEGTGTVLGAQRFW